MEKYDLVIAGAGVAGSVAAKFAAKAGLKVLLLEKDETPRNKPCSGIQFQYFEKIIGEKIPRERLCNYQIEHIHMQLPNGKIFAAPTKMLNFMRKPLDDWLNQVAIKAGAEFRDMSKVKAFKELEDSVEVEIHPKDDSPYTVKARYLVDATGLRPVLRKILRPHDFDSKHKGSTLNYYIEGTADLDPTTLYQIWDLDFNDAMFAWVYTKTLDDGKDYWVVGTGCNSGKILDRQKLFYDYICEKFNLKGTIVKKEGYSTTIDMFSKDRVWLGQNRIIMVGDAAGLVDTVRGVGMDSAGISGRLLIKAITKSDKTGVPVLEIYAKLLKRVTDQTIKNQTQDLANFQTNDELQKHMDSTMLKLGVSMAVNMVLNKIRPIEQIRLMP